MPITLTCGKYPKFQTTQFCWLLAPPTEIDNYILVCVKIKVLYTKQLKMFFGLGLPFA